MDGRKYEVKINGAEYMIVSNESEEYVQRVALLVNKKMGQLMEANPHLSTAMSAVLTSINLADDYLKNEKVLDNLRVEINQYMDEAKESKSELEEKKQEVEKLKEEVHNLQIEYAKLETELKNYRHR